MRAPKLRMLREASPHDDAAVLGVPHAHQILDSNLPPDSIHSGGATAWAGTSPASAGSVSRERFPNIVGADMQALKAITMIVLALGIAAPVFAEPPDEDVNAAYQNGDYATALRLLRPLADQGNPGAQHNLGLMYSHGQGVPQDYAEAMKWFRKAADQGYADAENNLGYIYAMGQGVTKDYVQSYMWFNLAAAAGDQVATKNREIIATLMTPAQIAEAQKLTRERKPTK
jgi:TPR repeat protein